MHKLTFEWKYGIIYREVGWSDLTDSDLRYRHARTLIPFYALSGAQLPQDSKPAALPFLGESEPQYDLHEVSIRAMILPC
jgi:hypothetical protein